MIVQKLYLPICFRYVQNSQYCTENPNIYEEPATVEEKGQKKRPKSSKKHKLQNDRVSLTESCKEYLINERNNLQKSVTSCGAQTDFSKRSSTIHTQTERKPGKLESLLRFCGVADAPNETFFSIASRYSKFVFVAGLTINLARLYRKMS